MVERTTSGFIACFALWTLAANSTVSLGGSLSQLLVAAAVLGTAAVLAGVVWGKRSPPGVPTRTPVSPHGLAEDAAVPAWSRAAVLVTAAALVGAWELSGDLRLYAVGMAMLGAVLAVIELPGAVTSTPPADSPTRRAALVVIAIASVGFTLCVHRPDADDSFYLNLAVAAVDDPAAPLIARDTLHGLPGVGIPIPVYKVHALEPLQAAISFLTGLPVLDVAHLLIPALAALIVPLAWARLLRILVPGRWLSALVFTLAFLVFVGTPHQGYANFGFVRLQQGKAILLSALLPLVAALALEFGMAPSRRRWLRLAAAQVACVGMSASGLWIAPALSGLSLVCATGLGRAALPTLLAGVASSVYPVTVILALVGATTAAFEASAPLPPEWSQQVSASAALQAVLGQGALAPIGLFVLAGSWALVPSRLARRFVVVLPIAFVGLFWNPWNAGWIADHVTGVPTYWRVFWLLPLPLFVALALTAPLELASLRHPLLRLGLVGAGALAVFGWAPTVPTWSPENLAFVGLPQWKIPPPERRAALLVASLASSDSIVLAPTRVARWIPTLHRHPYPLVVRNRYLDALRGQLSREELERRRKLAAVVSGLRRPASGATLLATAIEEDSLAVVCLAARAATWPELRRVLELSPLELVSHEPEYEVWARP